MDERSSTPLGTPASAASAPPPAATQPTAAQSVKGVNRALNAPARKDDNNVKETIESILVAFILAFIFRAFIVEAFVIPTGSMAPTLLGAHLRWSCNDCGYRFDTNYSADKHDADGNPIIPNRSGPRNEHDVKCPNCGFDVPKSQARNVPVHYGDRILVLKYLYLFEDPKRWDVVVFKSPYDPKYQQNYIKRMVGRPNESVLILDGDIYIGPPGATSLDEFVIQAKPKHVQDALWRVIYDNDYHPRGLTRGQRPWQQPWTIRNGSGWNLDHAGAGAAERVFAFDNASAGGTIFFDREANPSTHAFSDWLAYDVEDEDRLGYTPSVAGDLRVKLDYLRTAGGGPLRVRLSKMHDTFIAELNPHGAKLFRKSGDGAETELASKEVAFGNGPLRIEFENVDHQVTLRVNGDVLLRSTPQQYPPDARRLLEQFKARQSPPLPGVEISAEQQTSQVSHLSLWRDVYYLNGDRSRASRMWASPLDFPSNVIHLGPDEYFVLGDNSLASLDARMWTKDIELPDLHVESGRVPDRFMLGKAFFVYWPAGYKPLATESMPALTPNFGDMRFIR